MAAPGRGLVFLGGDPGCWVMVGRRTGNRGLKAVHGGTPGAARKEAHHRPWTQRTPRGSLSVGLGLRACRVIRHSEEAERSADWEGREEGPKAGRSGPRGPAGAPGRTPASGAPDRTAWKGSRAFPKPVPQPDPVGRRDRAHTDADHRTSSRGRHRRVRRVPARRTCRSTPRSAAWPSALQGRVHRRARAGTGPDDATLRER